MSHSMSIEHDTQTDIYHVLINRKRYAHGTRLQVLAAMNRFHEVLLAADNPDTAALVAVIIHKLEERP